MGTPMDLLKRHFEIVRESHYEFVPEINKHEGQVMVCFDDGWAGIYDHKDFFVSQNIYPTVFIAVDLIGSKKHLTVEQIMELYKLGFRFEAHTWSHKSLDTFNYEELVHELKDSKEELERIFHQPFNAICYPQGHFTHKVHDLCQKIGYKKQYSSINGAYDDLEDKGIICRNCNQYSSPREFKWMLNGTSHIFRQRLLKLHLRPSRF